jgi:hypothetical protein
VHTVVRRRARARTPVMLRDTYSYVEGYSRDVRAAAGARIGGSKTYQISRMCLPHTALPVSGFYLMLTCIPIDANR